MVISIVQKYDQHTGILTDGKVKMVFTSSNFHPYGIKIELDVEK